MVIYLSQGKYQILPFPHPCQGAQENHLIAKFPEPATFMNALEFLLDVHVG